jgi:hypothetical protein
MVFLLPTCLESVIEEGRLRCLIAIQVRLQPLCPREQECQFLIAITGKGSTFFFKNSEQLRSRLANKPRMSKNQE